MCVGEGLLSIDELTNVIHGMVEEPCVSLGVLRMADAAAMPVEAVNS